MELTLKKARELITCPVCGEDLAGDGYTQVLHCPNANPEFYGDREPDANPVYCQEPLTWEDFWNEEDWYG